MSIKGVQDHDAAWYQGVLNAMSDMVLVKGDRSKLLWANTAFLDYYGMTNQDLSDIVDADHSDPDDTIQYVKDDHFVYSTGRRLDVLSEPITNGDGETAYFQTVKDPVFDGTTVVRTVGVSRPIESEDLIEASRQSRHEQKSSLRELRTFIRDIPLAAAMFDAKQRFVTCSDQWRESLGYGGEQLVGKFYSAVFEAQLPIQEQLNLVITTGEPQRVESLVVQRSGASKLIADVVINPWQLPTGDIGGCIAIIHDVTDVTNSRRNLERVNGELTQFNYRVSHDLVGPCGPSGVISTSLWMKSMKTQTSSGTC